MHRPSTCASACALSVLVLCVARTGVALASEDEDIHFLAEHAVESGMDASYMSLPWPAGLLVPGEWQQSVDLAVAQTTTDFMLLNGAVVGVAAARGVSARWGYELMGSYSVMGLSGGDGRVLLTPGFLRGVPLDLPQFADFSDPRGTQRQISVGAAGVRELGSADSPRSSQLIAGLLLERVEITGFKMDYRLAGGEDAGTSGTLEYSSRANFITPFVAWQQTGMLAARWTWSPRAMLIAPLPPRDLNTRVTGTGFDVATLRGSPVVPIGDGFVTLGVAFRHRPSGLEFDLGGLVYYPVGESASHPGVKDALVLHVAWRHASR